MPTRSARRDRRGGVLVFCAVALVVMMAMAGLVIDGGNLFLLRQRTQAAADAAALAAVGPFGGTSQAEQERRAQFMYALNAPGGKNQSLTSCTVNGTRTTVELETRYSPSLLAALGVRDFRVSARAIAENRAAVTQTTPPAPSSSFDPFNTHGWFTGGIFSRNTVNISNSVHLRGYNSATGQDEGTADISTDGGFNLSNSAEISGSIKGRGSLNMSNSAKVGENAFIGGSSNMSNSARIEGNLSTNSTQGFSNSASVGGTKTPNAGLTIPEGASELLKPIDFSKVSVTNNNSSVSSTYLSNTNPPSLSLSNSTQITLAPGVYYFKDINLSNSAKINLSGKVQIYLTGSLNMSNSSKFTNTDTRQLLVYANGSANLSNSTNFYGGLYVPNGQITTANSVKMYGGFVANQINMANSVEFHVDSQLRGSFDVTAGTGNIGGTPGGSTVIQAAHFGLVE